MASNEMNTDAQPEESQMAQLMQQLVTQLSTIQTERAQERAQFAQQLADIQAEQRNERKASRAQIRALQETVTSLQKALPPATLLNTNPTEAVSTYTPEEPSSAQITTNAMRKKPILPDPPKFNGSRLNFRAWYLEMKNKLSVDGPALGSPPDQFAYIYSRLESTPQNMTIAFVERGGTDGTHDPQQYLKYLNECYGDPNTQSRAIDRLRNLRQKENESFGTFLPRFEKELADADGGSWSDAVRINYLEGALNTKIRERLVGCLDTPRNYGEFIQMLQILSSKIDSFEFSKKKIHTRTRSPLYDSRPHKQEIEQSAESKTTDEMEWEPTRINQAIQKANRELRGKRAKWVDQIEIDRRKSEGRCLRCGRTGCRIDKCPLLPAKRPQPTIDTRVGKSKPVLQAEVEEEDEESDQYALDQSEDESLKD
ncbi:hypothetical protein QBC36DRAFT_341288 [Triangularia setosa]|uniref:Uncharacterized protein n=1 Tax=Triangularia setosa TaxID=2587417 RepID=A0AAN6VVZ4_9PEZI|nr:hypothetical protein QBC36DRAFT_341288 [Podospora setosa]